MNKELTPNEIIFSPICRDVMKRNVGIKRSEKSVMLEKIRKALLIKKDGFNIYYVDSFSKEKIDELIQNIKKIYSKNNAPKDICYVTGENESEPCVLYLKNGYGTRLKEVIEEIKEKYYKCINDFYITSDLEDKEEIIKSINHQRNSYIAKIMEMAKDENFDVKATNGGFVFIPLKDTGNEMTTDEYDELEEGTQADIEKQASKLKNQAEEILEKLKDIEIESIDKLREIYKSYLKDNMQKFKDSILAEFIEEDTVCRYLIEMFENIDDSIAECYTINLEDDEEEIKKAIEKYKINVIVDNSEQKHPRVIYEEDPSVSNLIGSIEYKNNNGVYTTDISLISAGSITMANEGCLIVRLSSLVNTGSGQGYYYLKKALLLGKVDYNYSKNYLDVLAVAGLKPQSININTKVILIGDYESFSILFEKDEDFKKLFSVKIEFEEEQDYNKEIEEYVLDSIVRKVKKDKLLKITDKAASEIIKFLVRTAGSRKKINIDEYYLNRVLYLADSTARMKNKKVIDSEDVIEAAYEGKDVFNRLMENYENKKILLTIDGEKIGIINGLAVVGSGFYSFGKPMRITCQSVLGNGNIIDIHKESKMSGSIHEKSIGILKGLLSNIVGPYERIPVDFQLSFEQTYGMIEGDSASVAEIICILSALSKKPVRQNIAVTGSINQFGEVQPIGGVNEKIEGFFNVCNKLGTIKNKGVLIPESNKDELVLSKEVEREIKNKNFHVYTMNFLEDALKVLVLSAGETMKSFLKDVENEISKYKVTKRKKY